MTIYEKNMQAIREHHIRLHEYLETAQPEQSVEIRYEAAEDETLYPVVTKGGLEYRLNSKYNPKEASMQYISQFEKKAPTVCSFFWDLETEEVLKHWHRRWMKP